MSSLEHPQSTMTVVVWILLAALCGSHGLRIRRSPTSTDPPSSGKRGAEKRGMTTSTCGDDRQLTQAGHLQSPQYGKAEYHNDLDCTWIITAPRAWVTRLQLENIDAEGHPFCLWDHVSVYDGTDVTADRLGRFCGGQVQQTYSDLRGTGRSVFVWFHTDSSIVGSGFSLRYWFVDPTSPEERTGCDGLTKEVSEPTGSVASPGYEQGRSYDNSMDCTWRIKAPDDMVVNVLFEDLSLEPSEDCALDSVELFDGDDDDSGTSMVKLCGDVLPEKLQTTSQSAYVVFTTDDVFKARGFKLTWTFSVVAGPPEPPGCAGEEATLTEEGGRLWSPGYPVRDYPPSTSCSWLITAPDGHVVQLIFTAFSLEFEYSCQYDALYVMDGPERSSTLLEVSCGTAPPAGVQSSGRHMLVVFSSDGADEAPGFEFTWSFPEGAQLPDGCNGDAVTLTLDSVNDHGTVTSPLYDGVKTYPNLVDCVWRLEVVEGKVVKLQFVDFSVEVDEECSYDFLSVYDPATGTQPLCGSKLPADITSSTSWLRLTFHSDDSIGGHGFSATYWAVDADVQDDVGGEPPALFETTDQDCGIPETEPQFSRIVGGEQATPHSWPWQVSVMEDGAHTCGGTVIHRRWILTAAHCTHGIATRLLTVTVGSHSRIVVEPWEVTTGIIVVIEHPLYNSGTNEHDIALLKLQRPLSFSDHVHPVCLPTRPVEEVSTTSCAATGWGETFGTGSSMVLNQISVPLISQKLCSSGLWYGSQLKPSMICAGYVDGTMDSCQGDSGGPLVCRSGGVWYQVGVTSWGSGCAESMRPGVYVRVSQYIEWIHEKTNGEVSAG